MQLVVIAHNIRSTHNVGSLLRTCDGFGVTTFWATGYTPYPTLPNDTRLPHVRNKLTKQIAKTSLGAEQFVDIHQTEDIHDVIARYKNQNYVIAALEQSPHSVSITSYRPPKKLVLLLGEEVNGIAPEFLAQCDQILEIPMSGHKESFNVSVATGIALYALTSA